MNIENINLKNISKLFEYEKLSRDIDSINDIEILKYYTKCYLKLYLSQQEVISNLEL